MDTRGLVRAALPVAMLLTLLGGSTACAPEPASPPGAIDLRAILGKYLNGLPDGWHEIRAAELNDRLSSARPFLLDIREEQEAAEAGYIAGSMNIPIRTLMRNLDKLPARDRPIVVMCSSGHRSAIGMEALQLLGWTDVRSLVGGFAAWQAAKLPVAPGAPPKPTAGTAPDMNRDLLAALDRYFSNLPNGWRLIGPVTLKDLTDTSRPFQIDLREAGEIVSQGFVAGSTPIPIRTLMENLEKLPPDKGALIIVECDNGHRSAMAMLALGLLRYTYVRSLAAGLEEWTKEKLPLTRQ